jgi:hypothetical protein
MRGKPQVTAAHRVVPLTFQVGQELQDQLRRDVHELHGPLAACPVVASIPEEQRHRVAVVGHGSRAERALRDQVLGEELLHQRREAWRGALAVECGPQTWLSSGMHDSKRCAATAISSGTACRYQ